MIARGSGALFSEVEQPIARALFGAVLSVNVPRGIAFALFTDGQMREMPLDLAAQISDRLDTRDEVAEVARAAAARELRIVKAPVRRVS